MTVQAIDERLEENLQYLQRQLQTGEYVPQKIKRVYIPKLGSKEKRPLGIPTVRDRVVQGAVRHVLEPSNSLSSHLRARLRRALELCEFASYGFRPGRSCKQALRWVWKLLRQGNTWVVDAEIKSYFDLIPHDRLMQQIRKKVTDNPLLALIEAFLKQGIFDGMQEGKPEEGTPRELAEFEGAVLSPLLANLYLDPLDPQRAEAGFEMVRYADDFVILCKTEQEARRALEIVAAWLAANGLQLHPDKTRIVDSTHRGGFDFLGYHFERDYLWPRKKSLKKLKDAVRAKTKRCNGHSLEEIIQETNSTLKGWFGYFKHSHKTTFPELDKWIRMRLRSILRKRQGRKGRGRGADHQRWPNAYFHERGLFSLVAAHASYRQPAQR